MQVVRSLLLAAAIGFIGNAAAAADPAFGLVTGTANDRVSIAPLNGSTPDRNNPVSCPLADVRQALGRTPDAGDQVQLGSGDKKSDDKDPQCALRMRVETVDFWQRVGVVGAAAALVIFLASLAAGAPANPAKGQSKRKWIGTPTRFLLGSDGRYSNSQCQLALWFGVAMTMYLAMIVLRVAKLDWTYLDGVALTANVMALTGLSALTFGAAKVVTVRKAENAIAASAQGAAAAAATAGMSAQDVVTAATIAATSAAKIGGGKPSTPEPDILTDLFQNDHGEVDIGDFQMIFVALTAVMIFGLACFNALAVLPYQMHVSLPDVDSSLLAGFGIGQGAYLVKKAALPLGKG
ncbi:MAG TPA: hypothetical protein VGM96_27850 [Reyranella sp.]|jgi:hypothetical protein